MNLKQIAVATVAFVSTLGPAAHANLVTNGNFETTTYTQSDQFGTGFGGQGVTGWSGNDGYNIWFKAGQTTGACTTYSNACNGSGSEKLYGSVTGTSGGSYVALDGDSTVRGGISQMIYGLIVGVKYVLTFDWGAAQLMSRTGATTESLTVSLGSETYSTKTVSNPTNAFTGWFTTALTFTATSTSELLQFLSIGTPNGLPPVAVLDNVALNAVPEPVTMALLGTGLVGLGFARRRRA